MLIGFLLDNTGGIAGIDDFEVTIGGFDCMAWLAETIGGNFGAAIREEGGIIAGLGISDMADLLVLLLPATIGGNPAGGTIDFLP